VLELLRNIGASLYREIGGRRHDEDVVSRGAAGDKTYRVDRRAEEIILSALESSGEPLTAISEEAGIVQISGGGPKTVLIDPIDGSKNAVTGIPYFCTSIAVAHGRRLGDVAFSYIINLVSGEEFWAESSKGAFLNGTAMATQKDEAVLLVAYEASTPGRDIPRVMKLLSASRRTRCLGAAALDLAYLASGAASVFVFPTPTRSFDFAAGWHLVREAGGVVTDLAGRGLEHVPLGLERAAPVLASCNRKVHERALELLSAE
jgi:myo-inositol-1(or 4)-monophosphatase